MYNRFTRTNGDTALSPRSKKLIYFIFNKKKLLETQNRRTYRYFDLVCWQMIQFTLHLKEMEAQFSDCFCASPLRLAKEVHERCPKAGWGGKMSQGTGVSQCLSQAMSAAPTGVTDKEISIAARDGFALKATLIRPLQQEGLLRLFC